MLSGVVGGITILVKGFAAFYIVPVYAILLLSEFNLKALIKNLKIWVITVLVVLPSMVYYIVLNPNRSSDFLSFWVVSLSGMVLTTEFYADWLAMIKGLMGLGFFLFALIGMMIAAKKIRYAMPLPKDPISTNRVFDVLSVNIPANSEEIR